MRQLTMQFTTIVALLGASMSLSADTVNLRDGQSVRGTYLGGTARQIRVDVDGDVRTYDINQVRSVTFSESVQSAAPAPQPSYPPPPSSRPSDYPQPNYPSPNRGNYPVANSDVTQGLTLPADTMVTVRMIDAVNSDTARLGQTFRASVDEPVIVDGQQVIPRGADVLTKLVDDKQSGKLQGRTVLTLALMSIEVNGRPVEVTSTDLQTSSGSRGSRTAKVVGGTAALGAIIGAIAGGGKGAAIGAGSGAAIGGGAEVLTDGQKVKIPSETRLTFRLQAPARI